MQSPIHAKGNGGEGLAVIDLSGKMAMVMAALWHQACVYCGNCDIAGPAEIGSPFERYRCVDAHAPQR